LRKNQSFSAFSVPFAFSHQFSGEQKTIEINLLGQDAAFSKLWGHCVLAPNFAFLAFPRQQTLQMSPSVCNVNRGSGFSEADFQQTI